MNPGELLPPEMIGNSLPVNTFRQVAQGLQPSVDVASEKTAEEVTLGRRARERSQRRREILDVARQHFARSGYAGTTLEEIARQAEFAKPTLYQFFSGKEHLFHSILTDGYQDLLGILRKVVSNEGTSSQQLRALCVMFLIYYRKHLDFFVMHRQVQQRLLRPVENEWHGQTQQLFLDIREQIKTLLIRGMTNGDFQQLDAERVCATFMETLNVYTQAFQDGGEIRTATEMADEILNLFLNGLSSRR